MLRRELDTLTNQKNSKEGGQKWNGKSKEPVARFLKSYAVFILDHTGKEDTFLQLFNRRAAYRGRKICSLWDIMSHAGMKQEGAQE
jgi:hypothetical protein